ncbi:MAG: glycoside hydrolase family 18 protein [Rudaea sp.]|nr:glycoside hydrolase family 18 protein [Rudaea sp.]
MILRQIFAPALLLAATNAPAAGDFVFASNFDGAWISGYYVGYQAGLYPIADVDFAALTHLVVGRVVPNADGTLNTSFDIDATHGPTWAKQATAAAHAHGVKALLMLGGAGEQAGWIGAASSAHRATFVANLLQVADDYTFDGFDLDWEPLTASDQPDFIRLAQALRAAKPGLILTVPVGWINANFASPQDAFYGSIAPLFDQINIMSYGMAGDWDGWESWYTSAVTDAGVNTPSSVASSAAYYLAAGVPSSRLGVGIGFYGMCWTGVSGARQSSGSEIADDNVMSYENIMTQYYSAAWYQYDATAMAPSLGAAAAFGPASGPKCNFVSYEDPASVTAKGSFALQNKLGGTIIWTIGEGHQSELPAGQRDPLLEAVRAAFRP